MWNSLTVVSTISEHRPLDEVPENAGRLLNSSQIYGPSQLRAFEGAMLTACTEHLRPGNWTRPPLHSLTLVHL